MINLYFLKYFYDAASNESILKSAKINHVSPTAISSAIRKLEKQFQIKLLEHKKKHFNLTEKGLVFLAEIPKLLNSAKEFENKINTTPTQTKGKIKLATTNSLAISLLPNFLEKFSKINNNILVDIIIGSPGEIKNWVTNSMVDIGLTIQRNKPLNVNSYNIHQGHFYTVKTVQCKNKKTTMTEQWPEAIDLKKKYYKFKKKELPIYFYAPNWEIVKQFVDKNLSAGLLPDYLITPNMKLINKNLKLSSYKILIIKKGTLSPIENHFYMSLKENYNK